MLTVNCSMRMTVHNPAPFFGIHVSSKPVNLMYSEIAVATGEVRILPLTATLGFRSIGLRRTKGKYAEESFLLLMLIMLTTLTGKFMLLQVKKYHQRRKSTSTVYVNLQGSKVPLYGAGVTLASLVEVDDRKIPVRLVFDVKSRGNVVGKLVTSKHTRHVSCSVPVDSHNNHPIKLKENACRYF